MLVWFPSKLPFKSFDRMLSFDRRLTPPDPPAQDEACVSHETDVWLSHGCGWHDGAGWQVGTGLQVSVIDLPFGCFHASSARFTLPESRASSRLKDLVPSPPDSLARTQNCVMKAHDVSVVATKYCTRRNMHHRGPSSVIRVRKDGVSVTRWRKVPCRATHKGSELAEKDEDPCIAPCPI